MVARERAHTEHVCDGVGAEVELLEGHESLCARARAKLVVSQAQHAQTCQPLEPVHANDAIVGQVEPLERRG